MAQKLNSEFNYRTQVIGETPWEKIKTLKGFHVGRMRAKALEEINGIKHQAKIEKLRWMKEEGNALKHLVMELTAEIMEAESSLQDAYEAYRLNEAELKILDRLLAELYEIVEPTRQHHPDGVPFTDEEMFELNAANEFTVWVAKEMHAEMIANGRPSPARLRNAMSCPQAWEACKQIGLIPKDAAVLTGHANPMLIELSQPLLGVTYEKD